MCCERGFQADAGLGLTMNCAGFTIANESMALILKHNIIDVNTLTELSNRQEWSSHDQLVFVNSTVAWEMKHNQTLDIDVICTEEQKKNALLER